MPHRAAAPRCTCAAEMTMLFTLQHAPAGADEISRICRTLSSSGRVAAAAGGGGVQVSVGRCLGLIPAMSSTRIADIPAG